MNNIQTLPFEVSKLGERCRHVRDDDDGDDGDDGDDIDGEGYLVKAVIDMWVVCYRACHLEVSSPKLMVMVRKPPWKNWLQVTLVCFL